MTADWSCSGTWCAAVCTHRFASGSRGRRRDGVPRIRISARLFCLACIPIGLGCLKKREMLAHGFFQL
jgi:hypothetical protein